MIRPAIFIRSAFAFREECADLSGEHCRTAYLAPIRTPRGVRGFKNVDIISVAFIYYFAPHKGARIKASDVAYYFMLIVPHKGGRGLKLCLAMITGIFAHSHLTKVRGLK